MHVCMPLSVTHNRQTTIIGLELVVCAEWKVYMSGKVYHSPCLPPIAIEFNTIFQFCSENRDFFPSQRRKRHSSSSNEAYVCVCVWWSSLCRQGPAIQLNFNQVNLTFAGWTTTANDDRNQTNKTQQMPTVNTKSTHTHNNRRPPRKTRTQQWGKNGIGQLCTQGYDNALHGCILARSPQIGLLGSTQLSHCFRWQIAISYRVPRHGTTHRCGVASCWMQMQMTMMMTLFCVCLGIMPGWYAAIDEITDT